MEPQSGLLPKLMAWLPLVSVLIGIASLFYLTQTSELTTTGYSIQDLTSQENDWKLRNQQLSLEVDKARSLATVEAEATKRLGMIPPKNVVYLQVTPQDLSRRATPASRGEASSVPSLEKASSAPVKSLLDKLRDSLSSVLVPRSLRKP